jgi:excisionase family DNA binding protein
MKEIKREHLKVIREHYSVSEAAERTGMSVAWFRSMLNQRKMRHFRIGRRVFIHAATIDQLITDGTVEPMDDRQGA